MIESYTPQVLPSVPEPSLGSKIGSFIGDGAQKIFKAITGLGEYTVNDNSLLKGGLDPPEIMNSYSKGAVIVKHREYIADITASTAFTIVQYPLNPGLFITFPWLAQVASNYEQYTLRGMIFEFKSTSSDAVLSTNATNALGSVIMATQYNVYNPVFPDKVTMENYEFSNSSKPSQSFFHPIECMPSQSPLSELYVRTNPSSSTLPSGADLRLYDFGNFSIATQGQQANTGVLGELWCTYEIELYKPKNVGALGLELLTDHYQIALASNPNPLGTPVLQKGSALGSNISGNVLFFPPSIRDGTYMIVMVWYGTTATITPSPLTGTNLVFLSIWDDDGLNNVNNGSNATASYFNNVVVKITGSQASISFGAAVLPAALPNADLWIMQINAGITT